MKIQYKFAITYLSCASSPSNQGFILTLTMALGLVMAVAGVAMMIKAQSEQTQVVSQKAKSEGLSMAEVAVTKFQNELNQPQRRHLLMYPSTCDSTETKNCWQRANATTNPPDFKQYLKACKEGQKVDESTKVVTELANTTTWTNITDPSNSSKTIGQYKLIGYTYQGTIGKAPGLGKLEIEGRTGTNSGSLSESPSRISVQIPVYTDDDDSDVPGVWVQEGDIGGNKVQADVWLNDCSVEIDSFNTNNVIQPDPDNPQYAATYSNYQFPSLPYSNPTQLTLLPSQIYALIPSKIPLVSYLGSNKLISSGDESSFSTIASLAETFVDQAVNSLFGQPALAKKTSPSPSPSPSTSPSPSPSPSTSPSPSATCTPSLNPSGSTFPRAGDCPTKTETVGDKTINIYEYRVSDITQDVTVDTVSASGQRQKVLFYLQGDLAPSGNNTVNHICSGSTSADLCKPTDFQIFAYGNSGCIDLHGNHEVEAFIFAPKYSAGISGGGKDGGIKGSIWVKSWSNGGGCGSNSHNPRGVAQQTAKWSDLASELKPTGIPPQPGSVSDWQQQEVD